jgi:serine/threonine-protein kinase HipA
MATAVYPQLTEKMAMKIGSKYRFADVYTRHWEQFATSAGLSPAQVKKELKRVAERMPAQAHQTQAQLAAAGHTHPVLNEIVKLIEDRCATVLRRLAMSSAQANDGTDTEADIDNDTPDEEGSEP